MRRILVALVVAALAVSVGPGAAAQGVAPQPTADAGQPVRFSPRADGTVSGGEVVSFAFVEPVTTAVAWWSRVGEPAQQVPVRLATDAPLGGAITVPAPVKPGRPHRLTVRGTTADGRELRSVVTYYGTVVGRTANVGPATTVMTGRSPVVGDRGRLFTFTIETQSSVSWQLQDLAQDALRALFDEERGWTARGVYRIQRIDDPAAADIRVLLARPPLVDALCRRAGLNTGGIVSCWNGRFAALNLTRWLTGALSPRFASLTHYRTYLTNHEFGHGLRLGHRTCPRRGSLSPIMQQQTGGQDGCRPNGWPYPR